MENLTLETLPKAVSNLCAEVSEIKRILLDSSKLEKQNPDCWFDISELCQYLPDKPTRATVYYWVNKGLIPVHKGGKKLRFLKSEIDNWLLRERKETLYETHHRNALERDIFLTKIKKG